MTQNQHDLFNQIVDIGFDHYNTYTVTQWHLIDVIWDILSGYDI